TGAIYAHIYQDTTGLGRMITFTCDAVGNLATIEHKSIGAGGAFTAARICKLSDNYFVVGWKVALKGYVVVVHISGAGVITPKTPQIFHTGAKFTGSCPVQKVAPGIIVVAFGGTDADGYIQTIAIGPTGDITDIDVDVYEFDTVKGVVRDIITLGANWFAVIYSDTSGHGVIKSFHIANDGTITRPFKDTAVFDASRFAYGKLAPFQPKGEFRP
ncbi:unnamed protein product, partial [marine sediment metagenome]